MREAERPTSHRALQRKANGVPLDKRSAVQGRINSGAMPTLGNTAMRIFGRFGESGFRLSGNNMFNDAAWEYDAIFPDCTWRISSRLTKAPILLVDRVLAPQRYRIPPSSSYIGAHPPQQRQNSYALDNVHEHSRLRL